VLAAGFPRSRPVSCRGHPLGPSQPTSGQLGHDGGAYTYLWQVSRNSAGCRSFELGLADGEVHRTRFFVLR
jgi:hypothetical protein